MRIRRIWRAPGRGAGRLVPATIATAALSAALLAFSADADSAEAAFGIANWEAGTCNHNVEPSDQCTFETEDYWYTQAAGHPNFGITHFEVNTTGAGTPDGNVKDVRVDLPIGLSVNPEATPTQCTVEQLETASCPPTSQVGTDYAVIGSNLLPPVPISVYNMVPPDGVPAMAGLAAVPLLTEPTYLVGAIDPADYHEYFTIHVTQSTPLIESRLVFNGRAGDGTFIATPTACAGPQTTALAADSHQNPGQFDTAVSVTPVGADDCDEVPFDPSVDVEPDTSPGAARTDSPEPVTVELQIPEELTPVGEPPEDLVHSHVKSAEVTLPAGMGLNPAAAQGLQACTDAQLAAGTTGPVSCPAESQIGTVAVESRVLPPGSLTGEVYVGQPLSDDPASGDQFRLFVNIESDRYGLHVRLIGRVSANPETGRLTTVFDGKPQLPDGLPQLPFESFELDFEGGSRGTLTTPSTCGPHTTSAELTPWARPGSPVTATDELSLDDAPDGGDCPETLAERPFAPGFQAGTSNRKAGAHSELLIGLTRPEGAQELKGIEIDLPPGLAGRLAGVPYCPESAIQAAAANDGTAELAQPSCPAASRIGRIDTAAGSGPDPLEIAGDVYLAGPHRGAPLSVVTVTPAVAGPFDLGTVVVRAAVFVDPDDAQLHVVSDPIPHVFGGVRLDLRSVSIRIDRPQFGFNPTNCAAMQVTGEAIGGGGDPSDPEQSTGVPLSVPFQATGCSQLGFAPKLGMRLFGKRKRGASPMLRSTLTARRGDANVAGAVVTLPKAFQLAQHHIGTICSATQLAANACPARSVYGYATAESPVLDKPLSGPVHLTSSSNLLPDLLVRLRGQVNIDLRARIDSIGGKIRTTFGSVPDVPVSKFVLTLHGGGTGLLSNTRNLCKKPSFAGARLRAQNGKVAAQKPRMKVKCKKKKKKKRKKKGRGKKKAGKKGKARG